MKNIYILISFLGFIVFGCGKKTIPIPYSVEVNFINTSTKDMVSMNSTGYGENKLDAIADAQKNAFKTLIFRGLSNSPYNYPLIENENETMVKNKIYFENFFNQGFYKTFMTESTEASSFSNDKGLKRINLIVGVNYFALKKEFEQNNVIRKFGY